MPVVLSLHKSKKFSCFHAATLQELAVRALTNTDPASKARCTIEYADAWMSGDNTVVSDPFISGSLQLPDIVPRVIDRERILSLYGRTEEEEAARVKVIMKKNPIEFSIHGIANAELYAIDLFWDLIARFVPSDTTRTANNHSMPREFYDDMVYVVRQEAEHFLSWNRRLDEIGFYFGTIPGTDSLWQSAMETSYSIMARIAIINLTHEAKGLDHYPLTRDKFIKAGDSKSIAVMDNNFKEEIGHVKFGCKWFRYLCEKEGLDAISEFHRISRAHFKGKLKPPFNKEARNAAGITEDWYLPLTR